MPVTLTIPFWILPLAASFLILYFARRIDWSKEPLIAVTAQNLAGVAEMTLIVLIWAAYFMVFR